MSEIQNPTQPAQPIKPPTNTIPPTQSNQPQKPKKQSAASPFFLALLMFILGIAGGILLLVTYPKLTTKPQPPTIPSAEITLPHDAAKVQDCVNNKGELFARSEDIPQGPIYMVSQNKIIGLEYEINQQEFTKGKIYKDLAALNIHVNHINTGYLPNGHEGLSDPHSYIDLYLVDTKTEQAINCNTLTEPTLEATPSADITTTPQSSTSGIIKPTETLESSILLAPSTAAIKIQQ